MASIQKNPIMIAKDFLGRYNLVLFIVLISCLLILSILILSGILAQPFDAGTGTPPSFDQTAINRLSQFETSDKNTNYNNLPTGRINPFFE